MDQQAEEETTGVLSTTPPPAACRSGDEPADNFAGGVLGASRPRGRRADHYRSRNRLDKGHGGVRDEADGGVVDRFQAAGVHDAGGSMVQGDAGGRVPDQVDQAEHEDGSMAPLHTKMGQQAEEETTRISTPPPACRSGDVEPDDFDVGGVLIGASRRRGRWDDYRSRSNRQSKGYGGVRDLPDEGVGRFQAEHDQDLDGSMFSYLQDPLHSKKMDQTAEEETTGISSIPPRPSYRWGGQPEHFVGGVLRASRPRGRWDDYRTRNWLNRGYGGVRDEADGGFRFQAGGHNDGGSMVQEEGGVRDEADEGVRYRTEHDLQDGSMALQADGAVRRPQAGGGVRFRAEQDGSRAQADGDFRDQADGGVSMDQEDGGLRVYDNVVVGDPSGVVIGRFNYAGRKVRGRVSGNRVIR